MECGVEITARQVQNALFDSREVVVETFWGPTS